LEAGRALASSPHPGLTMAARKQVIIDTDIGIGTAFYTHSAAPRGAHPCTSHLP